MYCLQLVVEVGDSRVGAGAGGGGGAGGCVNALITNGTYPVTVGAGGPDEHPSNNIAPYPDSQYGNCQLLILLSPPWWWTRWWTWKKQDDLVHLPVADKMDSNQEQQIDSRELLTPHQLLKEMQWFYHLVVVVEAVVVVVPVALVTVEMTLEGSGGDGVTVAPSFPVPLISPVVPGYTGLVCGGGHGGGGPDSEHTAQNAWGGGGRSNPTTPQVNTGRDYSGGGGGANPINMPEPNQVGYAGGKGLVIIKYTI